ncbi:MAG: hypothetical protein NE328_16545 [Lentisphaeraceae bacterium]|nr:hypothetical protein [Lentisphaeraceae bacterium]
MSNANKYSTVQNCIIDTYAVLPEGIKIGYDLAQDKELFTVISLSNDSWLTLVDLKKFDKSGCCSRSDKC